MGADIYINSLSETCRKRWEPLFNLAIAIREGIAQDKWSDQNRDALLTDIALVAQSIDCAEIPHLDMIVAEDKNFSQENAQDVVEFT